MATDVKTSTVILLLLATVILSILGTIALFTLYTSPGDQGDVQQQPQKVAVSLQIINPNQTDDSIIGG